MSRCRSLLVLIVAGAALGSPVAYAQPDCAVSTPVYTIQGASHVSPLVDEPVETCGVVTAVAFSGYYLQDPEGDSNEATADGIYVAERGDKPAVGDFIRLSATVAEVIAGGAGSGNLSVTTLIDSQVLESMSDVALPIPVVIGEAGRLPPAEVVISESEIIGGINLQNADDAAATPFNPSVDGIDFYESLEGMRVTVDNPVAISGIRQFGTFSAEVFVLTDNGENPSSLSQRTRRGGILLQPDRDNRGDQNPERVQIQFDGTLFGSTDYPPIKVGDTLASVTGVMSYSFGNFEVLAVGPVSVNDGGLELETVSFTGTSNSMKLASYNVLNLSGADADNDQRELIASQIVNNLLQPDVIALQEVQDSNGDISDCPGDDVSACSGVLEASVTLQRLVDDIQAAGGIDYAWFTVDPLVETNDDNRDNVDTFGGASLGNIRNAYLYNPARVTLLEFQGITRDVLAQNGVSVTTAFDTSRDPLKAVFEFNDQQITIFNNHFSSRFGSSPIFGGPQPFVQAGEDNRAAQALAMNQLVEDILESDPTANVVVLGDLNTFEFTDELAEVLPAAGGDTVLFNLIGNNNEDPYSFIFEGNSQVLDHIFVTQALRGDTAVVEYVNVNTDFPRLTSSIVASDHEPLVASLSFGPATDVGLQLRSEVYSTTAAELFWNRLDSSVRYDIYRDGTLVLATDGGSYFDDTLEPGSEYVYTIEAFSDSILQISESIFVNTPPSGSAPSPAIDLALRADVYSSSAIELFWDRLTGFQRYDVYRDGVLLQPTSGTSFFEDSLQSNTEYVYTVEGFLNNVLQVTDTIVITTRASSGVSSPLFEDFSGIVYSPTALELFWSVSESRSVPVRYEITRNGVLFALVGGRSFFQAGLESGTTYEYFIEAFDSNDNSVGTQLTSLTTRN